MSYIESLEGRRLMAGQPANYGVGGTAVLAFRLADASETAHVEQILVDGQRNAYVVASTKTTLQVQRLTPAGTLDTAWGKRGMLVFVHGTQTAGAAKMMLDANDRLNVLLDNTVTRLTPAGTLDESYATRGKLKITGLNTISDAAIDNSNRLYVSGSVKLGTKNVEDQFRVERFISRGRLDKAFDGDGVFDAPFSVSVRGNHRGTSGGDFLRALPDGSVVAAGQEYTGTFKPKTYDSDAVRAFKFTAAGGLDVAYGTKGVATYRTTASNDLYTYSARTQGIRIDGSVVMFTTERGRDAGNYDTENVQISADGKESGVFNFFGAQRYVYVGLNSTVADADGVQRDLAVLDQRTVGLLGADGVISNSFNDGLPVRVSYSTVTGAADIAAADAGDGTILTAANNRGNNRVTVGKLTLSGVPVGGLPTNLTRASARPLTAPSTSYKFNVVFRDKDGIDVSTIDGDEIDLVAHDGSRARAKLVSKLLTGDGTVNAVYKTLNTAGSAWNGFASDNGVYSVNLLASGVKDNQGNYLAAETIGALTVAIA